ncbi:ROK family transcriptional regulator [Actinotalea sp. K2]|uniref:ROK family transcriptional regulator n=1 Tax=Actinotalea sp. K2 TaxID=2939438 RepID=UPI002016D351|nr:ROK family transcriptional regulator [Actinotalea sp. K2]MCL3859893.1 ROK family transcriptional regulator [Actinotalea sp. K2]
MAKDRATPGSQTSLREANRARIVSAVQQRGSITQVELSGVTGLSPATISNIVKELALAGVLRTTPTSRSGRRALQVTLARTVGLVAGVHFADRSLRVALADVSHHVVAEQRLPLPREHRADDGLDRAALMIEEMVDALDSTLAEVLAVGVGLPAPVDVRTGQVSAVGLMRGWDGVVVPEVLGRRLGLPVHTDNDANLGTLAEARLGAARGARNAVYVRVAHGVGAGLLLDGRVFHGRSGAAGELGHVPVVDDGLECRCGGRGCLETVVGAPALLARLRPTHGHLTLRDVVTRALDGDEACREVVTDAGTHLGVAIAAVCAIVDPELVVVGGELAHAGALLLRPLDVALAARVMTSTAGPVAVTASALGDQAEVRGALALALDAYQVGSAMPVGVVRS